MKTGSTLQDIAKELDRQRTAAKDYIAPQGAINAELHDHNFVITGLNGAPVGIKPYAHQQFAEHLDIPKKYYDRMLAQDPELLAANVNTWLHKRPAEQRMVRTLDGDIRAFLSPKYRPLDNYDLMAAVLPKLVERGVDIVSAELTETRMYIKGILPSLSEALPEGMMYGAGHDIVRTAANEGRVVAAIVISNSPVGAGAVRIEPSVFSTWCTNLAIIAEAAMKKFHVGKAHDALDNFEVFRDETREADDKAFWLKVRDITDAAFQEDTFQAAIASIKAAAGNVITSEDLPQVVEVATKRLQLPEMSQNSILTHLIKGGQLTQWGLSSAITAVANKADEYEYATLLERAGGKVLALAPKDWDAISGAKKSRLTTEELIGRMRR